MCGIFCIFSRNDDEELLLKTLEMCKNSLKNRGPDSYQDIKVQQDDFTLIFAASVLWLQGNTPVSQPLINENSIFIYNGDVFDGTNISENQRITVGDTKLLLQLLNKSDISSVFKNIQGPYSFIFMNKTASKLYFGRDFYGRRSLLIGTDGNKIFLSSIATRQVGFKCTELPAIGTFCYDLKTKKFELVPWQYKSNNFNAKLDELKTFLNQDIYINQKFSIIPSKIYSEIDGNMLQLEYLKKIEDSKILQEILKINHWNENVIKLEQLLEEAVRKRVSIQPKYCQNCIITENICNHTTLGVLFSGGLDCAILAKIADKYYDKNRPIDLLNVSFDRVKDYKTPDRITGLKTVEELKALCPNRQWNFVEINVTQEELNLERDRRIADLIYPLNSILDDSLGCALWFASRGRTEIYTSPCRILLVGMGADELFGGYTRHRNALNREGWYALHKSLESDWENLPYRNLARDDRVVSDHGRQLRTPYLDENVVNFVRELNPWDKTYPCNEIQQGIGEKLLLRCLAFCLGLSSAACFKKRAIQFGSRIANSKENAQDVCPRLL